MMTRRRCQVVGLAGRRFNPKLRMLMVVNRIDAMLPPWLKLPLQARPAADILAPSSALTIVAPAATARNKAVLRIPRSPRHRNHSESAGHSGQPNPVFWPEK
jgi:hypothetical protein